MSLNIQFQFIIVTKDYVECFLLTKYMIDQTNNTLVSLNFETLYINFTAITMI